jgi:E3 ubiquitin-protein ligase RNF220
VTFTLTRLSRPSRRGAALKARRSFNPNQSRASLSGSGLGKPDLLAKVSKALKLVQRHRRDRHVRLKELSKADLENDDGFVGTEKRVCPVCQTAVSGDADVVEAHVDACLAHAVTAAASNGDDLEADGLEEYEVGGETRIRIARSVDFRGAHLVLQFCQFLIRVTCSIGAGFDVRNPLHNDVEDEIDIDGDDAVVFGDAQFTEKDIIFPDSTNSTEDEEVRIDSDDEQDHIRLAQQERVGTSLRDLVAQGKVVLTSNVEGETTSAIVSAVSFASTAPSITQ